MDSDKIYEDEYQNYPKDITTYLTDLLKSAKTFGILLKKSGAVVRVFT